MGITFYIHAPTCRFCGKRSSARVDRLTYQRYRSGESPRSLFPNWSAEDIRVMENGTHAGCVRTQVSK